MFNLLSSFINEACCLQTIQKKEKAKVVTNQQSHNKSQHTSKRYKYHSIINRYNIIIYII